MRVIGPATEDDMVLAFLRAEIESSRFAGDVLRALFDLSGGTRRPADAIARMRPEWDVPEDEIREIADAVARGSMPPEIVVIGVPPGRGLVVLEGHVRLTGLLLRPKLLPSEVKVLLGTSRRIAEWSCYGPP